MTSKRLTILAAVTATALIIVAAFFMVAQEDGIPGRGELLFPDLMPKINEVREISLTTQDETTTVVHAGESWTVKQKAGYRAAMDKVRTLIIGLAELRIVEPKTRNAELHHKLGLEEVGAEGSTSTLVSLKDTAGTTLASLVVGKRRMAKGDTSRDELYVRKPDHPQSWLAVGRLELDTSPDNWVDTQILNVDSQRIRRVRVVHPRGHTVIIRRNTLTDTDYVLVPPPARGKVRSQFTVNNIADSLAHLTFDDVRQAEDAHLPARGGLKASLETFDGLRVTVRSLRKDGLNYVTASAEFDSALVQETGQEPADKAPTVEGKDKRTETPAPFQLKSAEDVKREVEDLNERFAGWAFVIPQFRADAFAKRRRDLIG